MSWRMDKRTTVRLPLDVMIRAKRKAAAEGRTLTSLIAEGVMRVLDGDRKPAHSTKRLRLPISQASGGLLPGVDPTNCPDYQESEDRDLVERLRYGFM